MKGYLPSTTPLIEDALVNYPDLSYLTNNYPTNTSLSNTMQNYVTKMPRNIGNEFGGDINSVWEGGFYEVSECAQMPTTQWYWIVFCPHTSNSSNYFYGTFIAGENGTNKVYICNRSTGMSITSSSWTQISG